MNSGQPSGKKKGAAAGAVELCRRLFDAAQEGLLILDAATGRVVDANPFLVKLLGFPRESLLGKPVWELGCPEELAAHPARFAELLAKEDLRYEALPLATSDRRRLAVEFVSHIYQVEEQRVIQCNIRDHTARQQTEAALRENEASLQSVLESTADGILAIDEHGKVFKANPRFAELWHIPAGVLQAGDDQALLRFVLDQLDDPAAFLAEVRRLYATAELVCDTLTFKDGRVFERRSAPLMLGGAIRGRVWSFSDITARKRAEEALRAAELKYRYIIDNTHDVIFQMSLRGQFVFSNSAAERMTGYTVAELMQMNMLQLAAPEHHRLLKERLGERIAGGIEEQAFEFEILRKDGRRVWVELTTTAVCAEGTDLAAIQGIARDITARKLAEEALLQAEAKYHSIFEHAAVGIFQSTPDGHLLSVNPAFAAIHGYASPQACIAAIHDASRQFYVEAGRRDELRRRLDEFGEVREFENQVYRQDGSVIWVSTNARVIRGADGRIRFYEGFVVDITERRRADEAQARLAAAVEQVAETIVITDPAGAIVYANPAFERITGYTRREVLGENPRILQSGRHEVEFYRQMWATLHAGHVWSGHLYNKRKDGTVYEEEATISPIFDAAGQLINYVAVKRDVTREMALEAQHRQAAKMEVVGQLAGGVAHDFNNKLQIIMGCVEMLLKEVAPGHPFRADLLDIETAAQHSAALTRQLLAFSRQQAITPLSLDINAAIAGSLKMLGRLIGENIQLRFVQQPDTGHVYLDPMQLDQILANLAVNARDAIAGTGQIVIEAAARTLREADCHDLPDFVPPGDYIVLTFRDNGRGMTPAVQAHLFEPFFTTKGPGKGTGLGLAMVYGIVKQNHGAITAHSAPGEGATFTLYLPRSSQTADAAVAAGPAPLPTGSETVLVVEDEEHILLLVRRTLAQLGYTVLTANLPSRALELCQQHSGPIHLLLSDVIMPEMSGKDLGEHIQQLRPAIRILYMSGYPSDIMEEHGHLGAHLQVLPKPFTIAALAKHVRAVLDAPPVAPP